MQFSLTFFSLAVTIKVHADVSVGARARANDDPADIFISNTYHIARIIAETLKCRSILVQ